MAQPEGLEETVVDDTKLKLPDVKLEKVETTTGEEEEEVIYKGRSRVFRYDKHFHTGEMQWKERGTGSLKLLKHKTTGQIRVLMRQDKTLKICANHRVDPAHPLGENASSDRAWVCAADDFADEELKQERLCFMFRDHDTAMAYKKAHDAAREEMAALAGGAAPAGGGAGGGAGAGSAADAGAAAAAGGDDADDADEVTVTGDISEVYAGQADLVAANTKRVAAMTAEFQKRFGVEPHFFARAPGRVNLIGEHIDYHGYNVLPMAITQDILVAVVVTDATSTVEVHNMNAKFKTGEIPSDPLAPVELEGDDVKWFQYFQCGYKAAFESRGEGDAPVGMKVLIDGSVPPGAGLSSSSAFVVASTLATACANQITLTRTEVAKAAILAERYCGTMGGGMDQTISCLGQAGKAQVIQFSPLKATPVTLPAGVAFVVAHSLIYAPKAFRPWEGYNCRVTEGKLAAKIVAKNAGVADWKTVQTVSQLQGLLKLDSSEGLLPLIEEHLKDGDYSSDDLKAALGVDDVATVFEGDPKKAGAAQVLAHVSTFALKKRMRHVASEAARVDTFAQLCTGDAPDVNALGKLLDASHTSCSEDYACSVPQLDELVSVAKASGALGARLTGAGWGGCMVAMVPADEVTSFIDALGKDFYAGKLEAGVSVSKHVFASTPGAGIAILLVE